MTLNIEIRLIVDDEDESTEELHGAPTTARDEDHAAELAQAEADERQQPVSLYVYGPDVQHVQDFRPNVKDFAHAGTVSHATLRPEDLIPAFSSKLRELAGENFENCADDDDRANVLALLSFAEDFSLGTLTVEQVGDLTNDLLDALDRFAPEGWYFGTLEGDGADFGFWRGDARLEDE
jgi:hypothetical protein